MVEIVSCEVVLSQVHTMMSFSLAVASCLFAALPAVMFLRNLRAYTIPELDRADAPASNQASVSILIPARNEERGLRDTLAAAVQSQGVSWEVVVLDDHSTDGTADIVREFQQRDPRVRLEQAAPLPPGWCGKQHACWILSQRASYDTFLFLDADVQLSLTGVAQAVRFQQTSGAALVSGVPRQLTVSLLEQLLIPLIHFILLGFLPLARMRKTSDPAFGAGCGQFFLTDRASYQAMGGHAAIRESLHDGVRLPRAYRRCGLMTDLFDATSAATCRMYQTSGEVWRGLSKNAVEGLAAPGMIVPATILLIGGQVLPFVGFSWSIWRSASLPELGIWSLAVAMAWWPRWGGVVRFRQPVLGALLHPAGVLLFLLLQWTSLLQHLAGRPASWKQRSYAAH